MIAASFEKTARFEPGVSRWLHTKAEARSSLPFIARLFLKGEIMSTKEQRLRRATIAVVAPLHQEPPAEALEERAEAVEHWRGEDGSTAQREHSITTAPES
jgi:hypothetical protein